MTLRNATIEALEQVLEVITLVDSHYGLTPEIPSSPIGKHVRHIVDHFWALQEEARIGCIDYNARHRDTALESQPELAAEAVNRAIEWLHSAPLTERSVEVISEISASHCETIKTTSTLNRELLYLINHTIHHVAYMNLLARSMGIEIPTQLGVAPATATFLRQTACAQ